jgi:hypothetical protein
VVLENQTAAIPTAMNTTTAATVSADAIASVTRTYARGSQPAPKPDVIAKDGGVSGGRRTGRSLWNIIMTGVDTYGGHRGDRGGARDDNPDDGRGITGRGAGLDDDDRGRTFRGGSPDDVCGEGDQDGGPDDIHGPRRRRPTRRCQR